MSVRKGNQITQKIVRHVGIAHDDMELSQLKLLAESIKIKLEAENQTLLFSPEEIAKETLKAKKNYVSESEDDYLVNLKDIKEEQRVISGIHDIYGQLFDELGYDSIIKNPKRNKSSAEIFKNIVLARIANPVSKKSSVTMLEENFGVSLNLDRVYQMMDKINDESITKLNEISYTHTRRLFNDKIDVVFFDCTTVYFESFSEDALKENGFSKDLKFGQPQVLIALMVTKEGLPIGYEVFNGSTYEGHTLIPQIKKLKGKYNIDKVVFVADSGMMNNDNLDELDKEKMDYVVGCRLKSLSKDLKNQITAKKNFIDININGNETYKIGEFKHNGRKIIVSYSSKRARKDAHDRQKNIEKIRKKLEEKKNPKEYISNLGYKKYLSVSKGSKIELNEAKIDEDSKWDGLHGVITKVNHLSNQEILNQYKNLWQVEDAFRITKHDLKVRPIYHWKPHRVKAHLAISFTAFSLVKFLEYRVKLQYIKLSPEKIRHALVDVQTSILFDCSKKIRYGMPSSVSKDAQKIYSVFSLKRSTTPWIIKKL